MRKTKNFKCLYCWQTTNKTALLPLLKMHKCSTFLNIYSCCREIGNFRMRSIEYWLLHFNLHAFEANCIMYYVTLFRCSLSKLLAKAMGISRSDILKGGKKGPKMKKIMGGHERFLWGHGRSVGDQSRTQSFLLMLTASVEQFWNLVPLSCTTVTGQQKRRLHFISMKIFIFVIMRMVASLMVYVFNWISCICLNYFLWSIHLCFSQLQATYF